jgi:hypothetical protein
MVTQEYETSHYLSSIRQRKGHLPGKSTDLKSVGL